MVTLNAMKCMAVHHLITTFELQRSEKNIMEDIENELEVKTASVIMENENDVSHLWSLVDRCAPRNTSVLIVGYFDMKTDGMRKCWTEGEARFDPRIVYDLTAYESLGHGKTKKAVTFDALSLFQQVALSSS